MEEKKVETKADANKVELENEPLDMEKNHNEELKAEDDRQEQAAKTANAEQQKQKLRKKVNVLVKKQKLQQGRHIVKQQDDLKFLIHLSSWYGKVGKDKSFVLNMMASRWLMMVYDHKYPSEAIKLEVAESIGVSEKQDLAVRGLVHGKVIWAKFVGGFAVSGGIPDGGYGTIEEVLEMLTWSELEIHKKPSLDAFFILWIFTSLPSTLNKLQGERPSFKYSGSFQSSSSFGGSQYGGAPQPYSYPSQNIPQQLYSYPPQEYPVQEAYPAYQQQYHAAPPAQAPGRPQKKFDRRMLGSCGVKMPNNATMIKDIEPALDNITVQGRVISLWHSHQVNEAHNPYSLDFVFQDLQNSRIQVYIKKDFMFRFEPLFEEGKSYSIANFAIAKNSGRLPLLPHKYKISFYKGTTVTRIDPIDDKVHIFILEPFNRLLDEGRVYHDHEAIDVIGSVVAIGDVVYNLLLDEKYAGVS
ncbi:replication protein A 70 kDa DNA-binding subunit B [Tanacetum coccineum]